ncbi:MAG: DUF819 family protein [Pirellulaceae bacterium]
MLLICYFAPSLLTMFGWVNAEESQVYSMAKNYLLPGCLILLTLSIDLKEVIKLGPKALIMFLQGQLALSSVARLRCCWWERSVRKPWVASLTWKRGGA